MSDGLTTSEERAERLRIVRDAIRKTRQPFVPSNCSADADRLDHLELHLASGGGLDCYLSTKGYRYKLADKYDEHVPYKPTLREAIDASRQNKFISQEEFP